MKKTLAIMLIITVMMMITGCSGNKSGNGAELALITATGSIDDKSFNQGAWEGMKQYADENNISYKYYRAADQSTSSLENSISLAVTGGAKVVVCPGYLFEVPLYNLQEQYPDVTFIHLDGAPTSADGERKIGNNVAAYTYAEEQAGFLAGYAAVKDGYRNLGFMGGIALPSVVRFGYGFVFGADYAAAELGLEKDSIKMNYTYVGNFDATPDNTVKASSWYTGGTEAIFACGGSVGNSVMSAAEAAGKKVIGVDVDQSQESETVITSAAKNISKTVYDALTQYYEGNLVTGTLTSMDATTGSVMLPMENSRFNNFTKEMYDSVYHKLVNGEITVATDEAADTADGLRTEYVNVIILE